MKITDLLERDKNNLLTEISASASPEKAVRILENETDRLLLRYNEQCQSERVRDAAAYIMQAVRLSLPFIDSVGKTKVWESEAEAKGSKKSSIPSLLLFIAGLGLLAFGIAPVIIDSLSQADANTRTFLLTRTGSVIAGFALAFIAGYLLGKPSVSRSHQHHVEIRSDADKLYRDYRTLMLSVDQSLEDIASKERWELRDKAGSIDGHKATDPEIELFADLLAASYSGDPEYALEKIDEIKYFLHRQQIEVVDYSDDTSQYFDLMPGLSTGTIRPALVADGSLLKKGLASSGR